MAKSCRPGRSGAAPIWFVCAGVLVLAIVLPGALTSSPDSGAAQAQAQLRSLETPRDLQCWDCQGSPDSLCGDEKFTGLNNADVKERNCSQVRARLGLDERTIPATFCSKGAAMTGGQVSLVYRGCFSPGEFVTKPGETDEREGCLTRKVAKGKHTLTLCLCNGDFCNGSVHPKMALTTLTLGLTSLLAVRSWSL